MEHMKGKSSQPNSEGRLKVLPAEVDPAREEERTNKRGRELFAMEEMIMAQSSILNETSRGPDILSASQG